jgi:hypothetical protein
MPSAPLPFGELFRKSVSVALHLWKPLFLGFLLYGVVAGLVAMLVGASLIGSLASMSFSEGQSPMMPSGFFGGLILLSIAILILGLAFNIGILILAVERFPRLRDTVKRIPSLFGPYIAASLWIFIRSYIWIPFLVGVVALMLLGTNVPSEMLILPSIFIGFFACAFIFGPRVMFGQVIVVREKVSGLQSVKLSEQRSKGYWGKIVGNWLLLMIILGAIQFGLQMLFGGVLGGIGQNGVSPEALAGVMAAGGIGLIVMIIVMPFLALIPMVFLAELHDTLKANPKQ